MKVDADDAGAVSEKAAPSAPARTQSQAKFVVKNGKLIKLDENETEAKDTKSKKDKKKK